VLETCTNVQALTTNVNFLDENNEGDNTLVSVCRRREMVPPSASMNVIRADVEVNGKKKYIDHMGRLKGLCPFKEEVDRA